MTRGKFTWCVLIAGITWAAVLVNRRGITTQLLLPAGLIAAVTVLPAIVRMACGGRGSRT